ncbi:PREDICTED: conserved oligomeric Golgi complex subunit 3-like [Amphimedon queenslandica]|uniref:Conserved oligomeric Golgi complex subunit 3 n=1 Tax=Amphimedon queenslandica TaxID=400682 RepID=A0A1X7SLG1_AMPQE|nr:PREDICTED: conserved oligomeric Golgi complex subunit 3-like [Amphimedon queenslandica]|eukprot:XP_011409219.1 PREDICTED: conserved oligomeric Golgi complex subunit 3-like [Amphimedon queenslandica]
MLDQLSAALESLHDMNRKHQLVSEKTQALHEACEQLVQEQNQLSGFAETISSKLSYFTELEQLGQKLNAPSFSPSSDHFPVLLNRLDECIAFIESHPHFKESSVYLARYKQQLSKALSSIKQQFIHTIRSTTQSVLQQQHQSVGMPETSYSQFYGKFRGSAPKLKSLMSEVELRAEKSSDYTTLLQDCLQCYISQRRHLLSPSVTATLLELTKHKQTEYSSLVPCHSIRDYSPPPPPSF